MRFKVIVFPPKDGQKYTSFWNSKVVDADTGRPVEGVIALKLSMSADDPLPILEMTIVGCEADIDMSGKSLDNEEFK